MKWQIFCLVSKNNCGEIHVIHKYLNFSNTTDHRNFILGERLIRTCDPEVGTLIFSEGAGAATQP
jgi:hypothetical protein